MEKNQNNITNNQIKIYTPDVDILEYEDKFQLYAEMPGVNKETLEINVENDEMIISGDYKLPYEENAKILYREIYPLKYHRKFKLQNYVDTEKIEAVIKDGILLIDLPKSELVKPKKIEIKAA